MAGGPRRSGGQASRLSEAEFRRLVDDLKAQVPMSGVVGRSEKLIRAGREWKCCCPFHVEKSASFYVNDAKEFGHCFGCGWHGDIVRYVMDRQNCGFREAYQRLANGDLPTWAPAERAKAIAEQQLEDLARERDAQRFFKEATPLSGTPGEVYARARGITVELGDYVRFGMVPTKRDPETGLWNRPRPAIICGAQDATGAVVGIQRIFFKNDDPRLGKKDCKLSLGTIRGSALRLGPPAERVILAEGPEDGFSIKQEGPGMPVWVPFGTSMMPQVQFPPIVKSVIIAGQNNTAGKIAVNKAIIALADLGLEASDAYPAARFDDWNDQLRGIANDV